MRTPRGLGRLAVSACVAACALAGVAHAQGRGGSVWTTVSGDAQRTAWVKTDPRISRETVKSAFRLLWKSKLQNQPKQLDSLTQPVLLPNIISHKGFKAVAYIGGSSDNVYALDYDLSKLFWKTRLSTAAQPQPGSLACPGALTTITRATPLPAPPEGGRGGPPGAAAGRGGVGGGRGGVTNNLYPISLYAISSGGVVHTLNPQTGEDLAPPAKFLPPNANAIGSILIDTTFYAATSGGCGGVPNGVWAVDLASEAKIVAAWKTTRGGSVAGTAGPAFGTDGTMYVATADGDLVGLDPKTLAVKDSFSAGQTAFTSSPLVFKHHDEDLIVAANSDGRLHLLGAAALGGADHRTSLYKTTVYTNGAADFAAGALASWADADGARWLLVPSAGPMHADTTFPETNGRVTSGAVAAFKVVDVNGRATLQPAWVSRDLVAPVPPVVVNGVAFALSSGEYRTADPQVTAARRARQSKPAVLYALDATSGRELWNSGGTITSFVHEIGLAAGDGQVYVVTFDGTVYAFGIPLEH